MNHQFSLIVNGKTVSVSARPDTPLLWVLREQLGLTGAKYSCGAGLCGACLVFLHDDAVPACTLPIENVGSQPIVTIEGLDTPEYAALVQAWREENVSQCGFCQPGQFIAACALLSEKPDPDQNDIDSTMSRVLCRCGTYPRAKTAIQTAASRLLEKRTSR